MNRWQKRTNDQLFYAQTLLALHDELSASGSTAQLSLRSLVAGAGQSIAEAWRCWLNELLGFQKESPASITTSFSLFLDLADQDWSEVQRLINLKKAPDSWLAIMLRGIVEPGSISDAEMPGEATGSDDMIIAVSGKESAQNFWHAAVMSQVLAEFKEYVAAVRSEQTEW